LNKNKGGPSSLFINSIYSRVATKLQSAYVLAKGGLAYVQHLVRKITLKTKKEDHIAGTGQRRKTTLLEQIQYQI
jgi:hypothetical protein